MNEKTLVILGTLGCILLGVVGSLIAWLAGGSDLTGNSRAIIRQVFNFQLSLLVVGLIIVWIPVINLLSFVLSIVGTVYVIKAFIAYNNNTEFKAPSFINIQ